MKDFWIYGSQNFPELCSVVPSTFIFFVLIFCRNVTSKTCPICRERVESSDETWVLTEKPDDLEYETEVKGYLVSLADKPGHKT